MKIYLFLLITLIACHAHARLQVDWEHLFAAGARHTSDLETDGHRLYLGSSEGIYVSRDHGATWQLTLELPDYDVISGIVVGRRSVYACSESHGVFRSDTHRALKWENKSKGLVRSPNGGGYHTLSSLHITRTNAIFAINWSRQPYMSTDRGESWRYMRDEWLAPRGRIHYAISLYDFDGVWWLSNDGGYVTHSLNNGETWIYTPQFKNGGIAHWTEFNGALYGAGDHFARYNPDAREWEYSSEGLLYDTDRLSFSALAVNRGRLFASTIRHGVYLFDERSETFIPIGFEDAVVSDLLSYRDDLYAVVEMPSIAERDIGLGGVYRASIPRVQSYGKAATTWGAVKRGLK